MKKTVLTFVFICSFSLISIAQQKKGDIEFDINVGLNRSTVSNSKGSADTKLGVNIGFATDYYFSNRWSFKGKLIYDQKGWNKGFINDLSTGNRYKSIINLNYLTLPVLANWHFGGKRNWYLDFGPYVGFLINANENTYNTNLKSCFNTTDFGLSLGIGVKIPVSKKLKISLEYEEQSGFLEIFKENYDYILTNNRGSLNLGINFLMK